MVYQFLSMWESTSFLLCGSLMYESLLVPYFTTSALLPDSLLVPVKQ